MKERINIDGWTYYNHAAIPSTAPHVPVNMGPLENGSIWKIKGGTPLLARWSTDWDCGCETDFWYVIKDNPCDGARSFRHQTIFQDYLEKYFGFRKAYCRLHIKYKWYINIAVKLLYPLHGLLTKSKNRMLWNAASLISMDKLCNS